MDTTTKQLETKQANKTIVEVLKSKLGRIESETICLSDQYIHTKEYSHAILLRRTIMHILDFFDFAEKLYREKNLIAVNFEHCPNARENIYFSPNYDHTFLHVQYSFPENADYSQLILTVKQLLNGELRKINEFLSVMESPLE